MEEAEATIREYLGVLADMNGRMLKNPAHQSPHAFMLEHGRTFKVTDRTYAGERMIPRECYRNAGVLALAGTGLHYAEGYTTAVGFPIPHAFLVNDQGEVIDPTLRDNDPEHGGRAFFGLVFERKWFARGIAKSGYWSMLDDMGPGLRAIIERRTDGMLVKLP